MPGFDSGSTLYALNVDFTGTSLTAGTAQVLQDGQLLIGSAVTPNIRVGKLTSTLGTVAITNGNGTINLEVAGAAAAVEHLTGNSGGVINPDGAHNINTLGTGSITISGAGNTLTTQLQGLTNHAIQIGAGTATLTQLAATATTGQVLQNNAGADPSYSTATYPSTTTINQILYSSAANTVTGLATANNAVLTTGATGVPVLTALSANGQLIIGSGSGAPVAGTLTAGPGISITNAANSITIATTGAGFTWTDATSATQALVVENGYVTDRGGGVVYTLPASGALGDEIKIVGKLGISTITPNANQQIVISSASGTVGVTGTAVGTNVGDCIALRCITAGASTVWRSDSYVGNWTLN